MEDRTLTGAGKRTALLYIQNQVVNLDRIAEISLKRERVALCFAFARINDPGARLFLSPEEAQPLLTYLRSAPEGRHTWVAVADRLFNLDLTADIWIGQAQVRLISALPDQRGSPIPRNFPRQVAQPILSYFREAGVLRVEGKPEAADWSGWVAAGDHLVNLALVSGIRFGTQHVQVSFAGLPKFARSFPYAEAAPLIDRMQQLGILPIEAVHIQDRRGSEGHEQPATEGRARLRDGGKRRRIGGWLGRRRE